MNFLALSSVITTGLIMSGCQENSFASAGGRSAVIPRSHSVALTCGSIQPGAAPEFTGMSGTKVQIEGELCSLTENVVGASQLSILFVLDYSGSMESADPGDGAGCGRLRAGDAIIRRMMAQIGQANAMPVQVGVVHFHDDASVQVPMMPLANFAGQVNASNFCGNRDAYTNYQAAFLQAQQVLAQAQGKKVIYFITDGAPTKPSDPSSLFNPNNAPNDFPFGAGEQAVTALRGGAPDLTINAIYLQDPAPQTITLARDPQQYLATLVGGPQFMRVANNADDLAAQIETFEPPKTEALDVRSIQAELVSPQLGTRTIALESLTQDPNRKGVWIFRTKPIELFGAPGQAVENRVLIRAQSTSVPETTGVVMFRSTG